MLLPQDLFGELRRQFKLFEEFGVYGRITTLIQTRLLKKTGTVRWFHPRRSKFPLSYRVGATDLDVFYQIFVDDEYAPVAGMVDAKLVIDCGANVGYSSAYFLSHFPNAHVIAIEPDSGNYSILEQNLRKWDRRAETIRAAIWPRDEALKISSDAYRDGREWAVQVRRCESSERPDVQGVSIAHLLDRSGFERISLLKIDIEGAEALLFRENYDWLERVDAIAIELHEDSSFGPASEIFMAAIADQRFEVTQSGELTICVRATLPRPNIQF